MLISIPLPKKKYIIIIATLAQSFHMQGQQIQMLSSGRAVSLRGLSAVNDQVIWVSGSGGTVGLSTDGGKNWKWMPVPRYFQSDFRDIEAFNSREAIIMGITNPAVILRTTDGGNHWDTVFEDSSKSVFLDAMDITGDRVVLLGDPQQGIMFIAESTDRGKSWKKRVPPAFDSVSTGETFFAASGSNIHYFSNNRYCLVSGGIKSNLYLSNGRYPLSLIQGKETTGANSISVNPSDQNQAFITGGDFSQDTLSAGNSLLIQFFPFRQRIPANPPHGYRSCVEYISASKMICCGTTGVDISEDGGNHWKHISDDGFHVCRKSKGGYKVFLAGAQGHISCLNMKALSIK